VAPQGPGCYLGFLLGRGRGHFSAQMVYDPNRGVLSGIWDAPLVPAAPPTEPNSAAQSGLPRQSDAMISITPAGPVLWQGSDGGLIGSPGTRCT